MCIQSRGFLAVFAVAALLIGLTGLLQAAEDKPDAREMPRGQTSATLDKQLFSVLKDVINTGADLYNKDGDAPGCYRLYQGALIALRPLLGHHPDLQKSIDTAFAETEQMPSTRKRAHALNSLLFDLREKLKAPVVGKTPGQEDKKPSGKKSAQLDKSAAPEVPANLKVPAGQAVLLKAKGEGVQIYECKAKNGKFEWVLKAPEADLFDENGRKIGKHYTGPTWELAADGSKVAADQPPLASVLKSDAVPWLLLKAKANGGKGRLGKVTYIQRIDTEGGVAPKEGADEAHVGKEERVKYKATYFFYAEE